MTLVLVENLGGLTRKIRGRIEATGFGDKNHVWHPNTETETEKRFWTLQENCQR